MDVGLDPPPEGELEHRERLLEAVAQAVTERGYAHTTIADVVRTARVSKRTFYEHFSDKEECFLAAYQSLSERLLDRMTRAALSVVDVEERLQAVARAYVAMLEERPALTRTFLVEVQAAGPKALKMRRALLVRFADFLRTMVAAARAQRPGLMPLTPAMASALVGGINELLLSTVEQRGRGFEEVGETAVQLLRAVLTSQELAQAKRVRRRAPASSRVKGRRRA